MLVNKKKINGEAVAVEVRYNQKSIVVEAGGILDVRDFGVSTDQMLAVENHIVKKNPGSFTQDKNPVIAATSKEAEAQILSLTNNLNEASAQNSDLVKENARLHEENNSLKNEQDGFETKIKGLKDQVSELKAKLKAKDMPEK